MASTDTPTSAADGAHHIVVGVDGSDTSRKALEWAAQQAAFTGAGVVAIASWEWPDNFGWTVPIAGDYDPAADAQKILDECLDPVRKLHPDVDFTTEIVESHPGPALVAASEGADLLVLGNRGHNQVTGLLIGSTSTFCVTHAACPVVVIRGH